MNGYFLVPGRRDQFGAAVDAVDGRRGGVKVDGNAVVGAAVAVIARGQQVGAGAAQARVARLDESRVAGLATRIHALRLESLLQIADLVLVVWQVDQHLWMKATIRPRCSVDRSGDLLI